MAAMARTAQYVTLGIDDDVFAVPVESVKEILEAGAVSRLPNAPPYLLGMIDVRGLGHPVVDLRIRLGLPPAERTDATRIVILNDLARSGSAGVGLLAERVFEVAEFDEGSLEPPPAVVGAAGTVSIAGVGRRQGRLVMVFDLERLLPVGSLAGPGLEAA